MIEVRQTAVYARWFRRLRDRQAQALVQRRILRLARGYFGDVRSISNGVSELRIHYGPGYSVYFARQEESIVVLLAGGYKDSQRRDVRTALDLARDLG